ncbi:hypothetical protein C8F04DRAFT_1331672 [Mycena alexandri]|uniref:Uncharacterized protein n=1 Tax=Mycena alexandri TaxID=1745969 RepID=A0AAD6T3Q8_9AGAR|nr:hypothetical protein C8F04DRAFT_1331672 [Mycena alexandri]
MTDLGDKARVSNVLGTLVVDCIAPLLDPHYQTLPAPIICRLGWIPRASFAEFISGIQNGSWGLEGAVDHMGNPARTLSAAEGYSYFNCTSFCGTGPDAFSWSDFSQQFSAWLLPWLALVSQLPFGGRDNLDNVMVVILAVGSPMLAAYSLALTLINGRWLARHFAGISYPNAIDAFHVLNGLQQAPLSVSNEDSLLKSLVVLPENDKWWEYLKELLHWEHTWNIPAATSIGWVFISYLFTVIDAFDASTRPSTNYGGWWTLPLRWPPPSPPPSPPSSSPVAAVVVTADSVPSATAITDVQNMAWRRESTNFL